MISVFFVKEILVLVKFKVLLKLCNLVVILKEFWGVKECGSRF